MLKISQYSLIPVFWFFFSSPALQRLLQLQTPQEELSDYKPHCYADEGESEKDQNLDAISIPEIEFHPDILTHLDFQFNKLAAVCRPDLMAQFE